MKDVATASPKNKQTIILEAIRLGTATRDSLMKDAGVNKAGLASQLAYLNSRGLAMAEVDASKAEFPMVNEDGIYYMGTHAAYEAKRSASTGSFAAKPKTRDEVADAAQKREDKASAAYSKAEQKAKDNPSDAIFAKVAEIRKAEMELASMKLSRVQSGDYSYENVTLIEDGATDAEPTKNNKKGPKPGSEDSLV
jgi:predicted ArsR family transcriptional regulator